MTLLLLVRHALTEATGTRLTGRTPGIGLSERGREQAARVGARLRPIALSAIYSSPLERCRETAAFVVEGRRIEAQDLPDVLEVDYGAWTGRTLSQLARTALWRRVQQAPSAVRFPGGESLVQVQRRAVLALEALAARHPSGVVAVVTHAEVIRLALAHYAGVHLDLFQRLVVGPASVSAVGVSNDAPPRILRVNDTGTLEDLVPRRRPRRRPRGDGRGGGGPG